MRFDTPEKEPSHPEQNDEIRFLAHAINSSRFAIPLRFLIDSHLPLRGIVQSSFDICGPIIGPFLDPRLHDSIRKALQDPGSWDRLVDFLYKEDGVP